MLCSVKTGSTRPLASRSSTKFAPTQPVLSASHMVGQASTHRHLPSHRHHSEIAAMEDQRETNPLVERQDSDSKQLAHESDSIDWLATGVCFLFPAIGGLLFGYDIGASSGVLVSLTSPTLSGTDWYSLSAFQSGLVVSMSLLGALMGSLIALASGNRLGRRTELLMAAVLYGIGAGGMGVSGSLTPLLACRVMYGLGIGFAMHAAPAYIAETSPPAVRGLLISLKEAIIVGGILAGYWSGFLFIDEVGGWRSMYGVAAPLALLLGVGMASLPESPRWLLLNGAGREEAVRALVRCEGRRASNLALVEAEVDDMAANLREAAAYNVAARGKQGGGVAGALGLELFQDSRYYRPLLVGMSLMLFQQITGQPSVLYYASQIFERAGFAGGQEAAGVSVLLGAFKLLMTLVAVATVDKLGRRPLLLGGVGGMVVALLLLTGAQGGVDAAGAAGAAADAVGGAAWLSAAALLLYVGCYQISFGPISWLIVGEVFPLAVRSQAIALATFVNFASNFGVIYDGFHPHARWRLRHIPGPPPLPFVGNTLEVYKHDLFLFNAWEKWAEKYGDVFKWFWGPQPVICVRDAELARQITVKHFKTFPDRSMFYPPQDYTVEQVLRQGITFAKGSYWTGLRGSLQPLFHSHGLQSYQPLVETAVDELCDDLAPAVKDGASMDMHAALCNVALKAIGEAAFGVKLDTQEIVDGQIHENAIVKAATYALENTAVTLTFMLTPPLLKPCLYPLIRRWPPPRLHKLNIARMQLFTAALTLAQNAMSRLGIPMQDQLNMQQRFDRVEARPLREKYANVVPAAGSVVDLLVRAKNKETGQPLKAHQIVAQANSILVAGHDTTSFMLTSTLYYVSKHPEVKAKVFAEIDKFGRNKKVTFEDMDKFPYLDAVLQESLRLSPPGWMTTREANEDITLNGVFIPKGSVVYIDIYGIQRSAKYWPQPLVFKPERFLDKSAEAVERNQLAWLAFGAGPRLCIGYKFALNEAKTVLVTLWQRYDFALDTARTSDPPKLRPGITLGYREGLWCKVSPRA